MGKNNVVVRTAADLEKKYNFASLLGLKKNVEITSQGLHKLQNELSNIVNTLQINLKDVLDDQSEISLWFFSGTPTKENSPYKDWENLEEHTGDIYYDEASGKVYQFTGEEWEVNVDPNLIEAMAITNAEIDTTEDHERKVFFDTPTIPYSNGDWWVKEDGTLYICQISKTEGELEKDDFIIADNYTESFAQKIADEITVLKGTITLISENFAKFTDLETGGSTTISGDNILTGTISADRIEGYKKLILSAEGTNKKVEEIEKTIDNFQVDLDIYNITIPTDETSKPLETKTYTVGYTAKYKGNVIVPTLSSKSSNLGITLALTDNQITLSANKNVAIENLNNEFVITFSYTFGSIKYTVNKKVILTLALKGATGQDGKDGTNGEKGEQGIPGETGADGRTSYFHIKYSPDGLVFSGNNGEDVDRWQGTYTDFTEADSTNFDDYKWVDTAIVVEDEMNDLQTQIDSTNSNLSNNYSDNTELEQKLEEQKQTIITETEAALKVSNESIQVEIDEVKKNMENGVETLRNSLVNIDINGINVSTNTSAISTLMANDKFSIKSKNADVFFVGYDYDLKKTVSKIDNLTVANYLTTGYHRLEKFEIDGEKRTGLFFVGE